jgi:galactokinase
MARRTLDLKTLVKVCQKAEHEFANVPCGIMDQTIVLGAKAGNAMLLDCRSFSTRFVPISPAIRIVIVNTEVAHTLASGEYARRRQQCEAALEAIVKIEPSVKSLRDVDESLLERSKSSMDDLLFRRARHVITENRRTVEAADCLEKGDFAAVGKLMLQSHKSLREDYEVSCPELDTLVDASVGLRGVMGARMTGGGFGGCIVALVEAPAAAAYQKAVAEAFASRYSRVPPTIVTSAAAGAAMISTQEPKHL